MATDDKKLMYDDKEISLIKATFAENDELLILVRKLFFGLELSQSEKDLITSSFANKEVVEVLRKKVYGLNNYDTPVGQLSDFWMGVEKQIFGASRDTIYQAIVSKSVVFEWFEKAFKLLSDPNGEKVSIKIDPKLSVDELQVNLIARNLYMQAIETSLLAIKTIAGIKTESTEDAIKRLKQDSSK